MNAMIRIRLLDAQNHHHLIADWLTVKSYAIMGRNDRIKFDFITISVVQQTMLPIFPNSSTELKDAKIYYCFAEC